MQILHIDHIVLTIRDVEGSIRFYTRVLGMEEVTFQGTRKAVRFGAQKINFHSAQQVVDPNALHATPGSADICLIVAGRLEGIICDLQHQGIAIIEGPVIRTGAQGAITSIYVRDPDENLIEIATYST